jgi:hypothetical protein
MFRKPLTLSVLLAVLAVSAVCRAQTPVPAPRLDAETMKAALKTATIEEGGFIECVVRLVNAGKLPQSLVVSTFIWARRKPRWKFQYFRVGLIIRARWSGIRL